MIHETKNEWFQNASALGKILYVLGCLKLVEKKASRGEKWRYLSYARRIHPLTWVIILVMLIGSVFNQQAFRDIKKDTVWY